MCSLDATELPPGASELLTGIAPRMCAPMFGSRCAPTLIRSPVEAPMRTRA